jgi:hypothetical protein
MVGAKNSILVGVSKPPCRTIALLGCLALLMVGCDRGPGESAAPATQPAAAAAAPAASAPVGSTLLIGDEPHVFGPAMLRLTQADGKVEARLYSNDPPGALAGKETVDSYDFDMVLPDISDPAEIAQAAWVAKSASSDREDTPYGIFLNQQQDVLQPMDVTVHFVGQAPNVRVEIDGTFWMFRAADEGTLAPPPPVMVRVLGSLETTATVK